MNADQEMRRLCLEMQEERHQKRIVDGLPAVYSAVQMAVTTGYSSTWNREHITVSGNDTDVFIYVGKMIAESRVEDNLWRIDTVTMGNELADNDTAQVALSRMA